MKKENYELHICQFWWTPKGVFTQKYTYHLYNSIQNDNKKKFYF
jgi:hypothetical protein